jgi:hypothetical protein
MEQGLTRTNQHSLMVEQVEWSKLVSQSDIIPDSYKGKPANILIAVGFGAAMGLSQAESLYRISVIKGKPTMSAELIAAQVRKAGHKLRLEKDEKKQSVVATVVRSDDPDYPISVTRDLAWAKSMGLANNQNYQKQPMTMLTWRAITAVAREACPEALFGVVYTPDEMSDLDNVQVEAKVEDTTVPEPVEPEIVDKPDQVRVKQLKEIARLMEKGGVDSKDKAAKAFKALTGRDITGTKELEPEEIEALLSAPQMVTERSRDALKVAEKPVEGSDAAPQES